VSDLTLKSRVGTLDSFKRTQAHLSPEPTHGSCFAWLFPTQLYGYHCNQHGFTLTASNLIISVCCPTAYLSVCLQVQAWWAQGSCQAGVQDEPPGVCWACAPAVGATAATAHGGNGVPVSAAGKQVS
jgi:hypothetical protein